MLSNNCEVLTASQFCLFYNLFLSLNMLSHFRCYLVSKELYGTHHLVMRQSTYTHLSEKSGVVEQLILI